MTQVIQIIPIMGIPIIESETQFWQIILNKVCPVLEDNDILVTAHTPWSRVRNHIYNLDTIEPGDTASKLSTNMEKDPRIVEVILRESKEVVKTRGKVIVTQNRADVICANAGIDQSNAGIGQVVAVPPDPDTIALEIKNYVFQQCSKQIAVIISDTVGRALRRGAVNIGIGCAGIGAMRSEIGKQDLFGYTLQVSEIAIIDELASAAELVQGQSNEGIPLVVIRGYDYVPTEGNARRLNRPKHERIFQ